MPSRELKLFALLGAALMPIVTSQYLALAEDSQPRAIEAIESAKVGVNYNDGGPQQPVFAEHIFKDASEDRWPVPAISSVDLAQGIEPTVLSGAPHALSGGTAKLTDGSGPADDDEPRDCFFFDNGLDVGRFRISLSSALPIAQINAYSWHRNALSGGVRAPHHSDVYASDGSADGFEIDNPHGPGYRLLATVNTTYPGGVNAQPGQHGSSIHAESGESLGSFKHFIFEVRAPFEGALHSFLCEIDIVKAEIDGEHPSPSDSKQARNFDERIAPILARRCLDCHNASDRKGGLDLSQLAGATAGGDSGSPIERGNPDESYLVVRVEAEDMPPDNPLPDDEKRLLRDWIAAGAHWGSDPIDHFRYGGDSRAGYDWWSLQPLKKPNPPAITGSSWAINPIDHFIAAQLDAKGLTPSARADRRTLIRRLSFDLIGLPPSPAEVSAFVNDKSPDAYRQLVDRLLASPHYGERWARHWLDIVRFAESEGFERNKFYPSAWKYRDWVIQALNDDMPYDEFARLQIAGDQLATEDPRAAAATGYLVCGPHDLLGQTQGSKAMRTSTREDELEEVVGNVGQTFLGMTINCARCHDHKFDPLYQREYYQLASALGGIERGLRRVDPPNDMSLRDQLIEAMQNADRRLRKALGPADEGLLVEARKRAIEAARAAVVAAEEQAEAAKQRIPASNDEAAANARQVFADRERELFAARDDLQTAENPYTASVWDSLRAEISPDAVLSAEPLIRELSLLEQRLRLSSGGYVQCAESAAPRYFHLLARGSFREPLDVVAPRGFECLPSVSADWGLPPNAPEGARRVSLAEWITDPKNPLAARVIANRLWHYHFGVGIVETPNDFGFSGGRPSHPNLLDWLAAELIESGWSLKHLHRQIVLSATYQQASAVNPEYARIDADNRLLWRKSPLRLDAEVLRDAVLAVSGSLNSRMGGPSFRDVEMTFADNVAYHPVDVFNPSVNRRSIYRTVARGATPTLLETLDCADPTVATPARSVTTTPLQALSLLNNAFMIEAASALANRVQRSAKEGLDRQIEEVYLLTVARRPSADELDRARAYAETYSLADFCLVMFNTNEFMYVD